MAQTATSLYRMLGSLCVLLMMMTKKGSASSFKVGGGGDWSVPSHPNTNTYNQWAEKSRFQVGDTLTFVYPADKDSVLLVTEDDYTNCKTDAPLEKHSDGQTTFSFNHSGAFYFISGVQENCKKNEKVVVVVMADRSGRSSAPSPSPSSEQEVLPPSPPPAGEEAAPSPAESAPPAPTTSSEVPFPSPSSAPAGEEAPPPPDYSTPAPSQESNPPKKGNGASSVFTGISSSIGALIGSSIILAF